MSLQNHPTYKSGEPQRRIRSTAYAFKKPKTAYDVLMKNKRGQKQFIYIPKSQIKGRYPKKIRDIWRRIHN